MKRTRIYVTYSEIEGYVKQKLGDDYAEKEVTLINISNNAEERDIDLLFAITPKDEENVEEIVYTERVVKTNMDTNEKQMYINVLED